MFLIKKLIIVVAILLAVVLGGSLVSRSIEIGSGGSSSDDGYTGIGLPTSSIELLNRENPLSPGISNISDSMKEYGVFSHNGKTITYDDRYSNMNFDFNKKEAVRMMFGSKYDEGFSLSEYSHFKIEFDVFAENESDSALCCYFALVGRNSNNTSELLSLSESNIKVDLKSNGDSFYIKTFNDKIIEGDFFHVVYVIEVNEENYNQSRMQVFVNDILYEDSVYSDRLFSRNDADRISCVVIKGFKCSEDKASVSFKNLVVSGYQEVGG